MRKDRDDPKYHPDMPKVEAVYLIGYLWEIGPTMAAGGYPGPVTHEEIISWQELTGIELRPWEVRFLRRLSGEYIVESQRAEKIDCPAPAPEFAPNLSNTWKSLQKSIRGLASL
jgi:hypothetical protein